MKLINFGVVKAMIGVLAAALISSVAPNVLATNSSSNSNALRLKELGRFESVRPNLLTGYGLVIGLSGSGDSSRNKATVQSLANTLQAFGVNVDKGALSSRNVAAVIVTAQLPAFANQGDRLDVTVSSIGDARSLRGGTLLRTSLKGVDAAIYSLAQGQIIVGGYNITSFDSRRAKNHSTVGIVPQGAIVERAPEERSVSESKMTFVLNSPDYVTMNRVVRAIRNHLPKLTLTPVNPGKLEIRTASHLNSENLGVWAALESIRIVPDSIPRIVVNERSGIVVAGGNILLGAAVIAHGGLEIKIDTHYGVSQPFTVGWPTRNIRTQVIPDTEINTDESGGQSLALNNGSKVIDLVNGLKRLNVPTADLISILQALKKSGALNAQIIVE